MKNPLDQIHPKQLGFHREVAQIALSLECFYASTTASELIDFCLIFVPFEGSKILRYAIISIRPIS